MVLARWYRSARSKMWLTVRGKSIIRPCIGRPLQMGGGVGGTVGGARRCRPDRPVLGNSVPHSPGADSIGSPATGGANTPLRPARRAAPGGPPAPAGADRAPDRGLQPGQPLL